MYTRLRRPNRQHADANNPTATVGADGYEIPITDLPASTAACDSYAGYEIPIPSERAPLPSHVRVYENTAEL